MSMVATEMNRMNATRVRYVHRAGFTLIEVMVATAITLVLMASVASIFAFVTGGINDSRATLEMVDALRHSKNMLQADLNGLTAPLTPPLNPDSELGYFEYIEGPQGPIYCPTGTIAGVYGGGTAPAVSGLYSFSGQYYPQEEAAGDTDDILMFTTRALEGSFACRWHGTGIKESPYAEVCWFLRGSILYRRQLLVIGGVGVQEGNDFISYASNYFNDYYDCSMHPEGGPCDPIFRGPMGGNNPSYTGPLSDNSSGAGGGGGGGVTEGPNYLVVRSNSLGDLTKRENRYGHQPFRYPYDARFWGRTTTSVAQAGMGLPTLNESTDPQWPFPLYWKNGGPQGAGTTVSATSTAVITNFGAGRFLIAPFLSAGGSITYSAGDLNGHRLALIASGSAQYTYGKNRGGTYSAANPYPVTGFTTASGSNIKYLTGYLGSGTAGTNSRYEDVILSNCIGFDVKAWDPGAPVFEVAGPAGSSVNESVGPGDQGYPTILNQFIRSGAGGNILNITFGAYVDLNYMQRVTNLDPYNPIFHNGGTFPVTAPTAGNYEVALQSFEKKATPPVPVGTLPRPHFSGPGDPRSGLYGLWPGTASLTISPAVTVGGKTLPAFKLTPSAQMYTVSATRSIAAVYDTWSTHYERDGQANNLDGTFNWFANPANAKVAASGGPIIDPLANGQDDDGKNGVDDPGEAEAPPPYPYALRGLQIKIRCMEPDTKQVREVTVAQRFLPE